MDFRGVNIPIFGIVIPQIVTKNLNGVEINERTLHTLWSMKPEIELGFYRGANSCFSIDFFHKLESLVH